MGGVIGHPCIVNGALTIQCLEPLFARFIAVSASLAGVIFFVMLVIGGFRYLFSGGNPKALEAAKGTMMSAGLGLTLVVSAFIIINIIAAFTGLPQLLRFQIKIF